jgi:Domain of unknown function (DUF4198)
MFTNLHASPYLHFLFSAFIKRGIASFGCLVCLPALAFWHAPLQAHEFWIEPVTASPAAGGIARFNLRVGEQFSGDLVGVSRQQTAGLRHYSASGAIDLRPQLPTTPAANFEVTLNAPGTHLIAFESEAHTISLSADSFHAYLHDEGLDFIKTQREATGKDSQPGRERYRRYVKTLVSVSSAPSAAGASVDDVTHAKQVGQRLELLPLNNPLLLAPGDALRVRVDFEGKPLAGALLKAWHKHSGQTVITRATTAADGVATVNLPYAGAWMVSVVHMVAAKGVKDIDWDSMWGNLSFVMPERN